MTTSIYTSNSYSLGNVTLPNVSGSGSAGPSYAYSSVDTMTLNPYSTSWNQTVVSGKLILNSSDADVVINGESLNDTLRAIQEELRMPRPLQRNTDLESEYDDLRQLAEEYQQRVRHYQEQRKIFGILKND